MSGNKLRCWSCAHFRHEGCAIGRAWDFSHDRGNACTGFDYDPGSDERELEEDSK